MRKTQFKGQERNAQYAIALLNYLKCIAPQQLMLRTQIFTKFFLSAKNVSTTVLTVCFLKYPKTRKKKRRKMKVAIKSCVEAMQFNTNTQSHWSSGSTVCFPGRESAVCVLGMHKVTMKPGFSC
jgi:hypothetical protein